MAAAPEVKKGITEEQQRATIAGFEIPADRKFIIVHGDGIGKEHHYSGEELFGPFYDAAMEAEVETITT